MFRKYAKLAVLTSFVVLTGCATTGANRQSDIDALNARIIALQGELAEKDAELAKLGGAIEEQSRRRESAESELKRIEGERRALVESKKAQEPESDLK